MRHVLNRLKLLITAPEQRPKVQPISELVKACAQPEQLTKSVEEVRRSLAALGNMMREEDEAMLMDIVLHGCFVRPADKYKDGESLIFWVYAFLCSFLFKLPVALLLSDFCWNLSICKTGCVHARSSRY